MTRDGLSTLLFYPTQMPTHGASSGLRWDQSASNYFATRFEGNARPSGSVSPWKLRRAIVTGLLLAVTYVAHGNVARTVYAAEGDLIGRFGMRMDEVLTLLGPSATRTKNNDGDFLIEMPIEIGGVDFTARYFFSAEQLIKVILTEDETVRNTYFNKDNCEQLAEYSYEQIIARYGNADDDLVQRTTVKSGIAASSWESKFSFSNGGVIALSYFFATAMNLPVCVGQIAYYQNSRDLPPDEKGTGQF